MQKSSAAAAKSEERVPRTTPEHPERGVYANTKHGQVFCSGGCLPQLPHTHMRQRGDTGQKPKHALFCMKGATTHTSLH